MDITAVEITQFVHDRLDAVDMNRSNIKIDETSADLDPTGEPSALRRVRGVRYNDRFLKQVRELGGIETEAALIAHRKS